MNWFGGVFKVDNYDYTSGLLLRSHGKDSNLQTLYQVPLRA